MKLDVDALRYLSKDDFRVLTAVEMGMRNHEIVPAELVDRIAGLKHGGTYKVLKNLLKNKLVHHDSSKYDGFRLTYLGYDFLAIKTLVNRGVFSAVGRQIGVGKESDIFEVATEDGTILAMKLHRLGRVSFRAVKAKRDYLLHRNSYNWLYLSRLAALKEYAFMKALGEHGFPVPTAVDCNRHCVIMSLVKGYPLVQVKQLQNPDEVFETVLGLIVRLAEHGLIHCDFNEFNIMIDDNEEVTMIDFPQMVSVSHRNAEMYFDRDVECIFKFFRKRFNLSGQDDEDEDDNDDGSESELESNSRPTFSSITKSSGFLDKELAASGFTRRDQDDIEKYIDGGGEEIDSSDSNDEVPADQEEQDPDENHIPLAVNMNALHLADQHNFLMHSNDKDALEELQHSMIPSTTSEAETSCAGEHQVSTNHEDDKGSDGRPISTHTGCSNELEVSRAEEQDDSNELNEDDALLTKRLSKQRRRAVAAAQGGHKAISSRNSYKDKGGRSSNNSKLQKHACKW
ncbi:Non-specific serine/threonine protein kinase protein [Dioscorea alata]|uniref:Non-specific serine/threonine protein kinase protein n=1 Tax=Dioscorea alata TaxID=55571 RepID=A0ACB7USS7_DIOAL|nr:Non-specific serine/threonine protein kinase protein [Dioscorea alata]